MVDPTSGVRELARAARERAGETRADAAEVAGLVASLTLPGGAGTTGWTGMAAEAAQDSAAGGCAGLERVAEAHDAAAGALDALADAVAHRLDVLGRLDLPDLDWLDLPDLPGPW